MKSLHAFRSGESVFKFIHIFMVVMYVLMIIQILTLNIEQRLTIIALCFIFFILAVIRHLYLMKSEKNILKWIFPYLEGILLVTAAYIDPSLNMGISLFVLLVMDVAIDYEPKFALIFDSIGVIITLTKYAIVYQNQPVITVILIFLIGTTQFIVYAGFAFLARMYGSQNRALVKTTAELHSRMIAMEQMAVLKERNRIAGEIHNTVGHQLTTALVQVEAAQLLMDKDPQEAKRRLGIIKDQVKDGLNELRRSIHAISAEDEYSNFSEAAGRLAEQVRTHSGIELDCEMEDIEEVRLVLKKTLYHIILESITNAIRHGNCQAAKVRLVKSEGMITLTVFNNGSVPKNLKYGFGLSKMKESLTELGGKLSMKLNEEGWFEIIAELPLYYQEVACDGEDQDYAG